MSKQFDNIDGFEDTMHPHEYLTETIKRYELISSYNFFALY